MVTKQAQHGYTLAQEIALGEACCFVTSKKHTRINSAIALTLFLFLHLSLGPPPVTSMLGRSSEAELATTLWDSNANRLNRYQEEAVKLALSNKFVMIQGPPGNYTSICITFKI